MIPDRFLPEEDEVVATIARFVAQEVRPHVGALERKGEYPDALVAQMRELGLFGMAVPEEHGGLGLRVPVFARVMEELAKGWTTLAAFVNSHSTVSYAIATHGTEEQKARYLPAMAAGDVRGSLCLTESGAGSDLQAIRTTALPEDGGYRLNGNKIYVTNGDKAALLLVLCRTDPKAAKPSRGISVMLVDKHLPGVAVAGTFHKLGFGLVDTVEINLEGVRLSADAVLGGTPGKGFAQLLESLEMGRIAIAASAVGLAAAALGEAVRFSGERSSFGQTINRHQAVQLRLADMATKLVGARTLVALAAEEKGRGARADMVSAMAKLAASEAAADIAKDAMRVHGGHGYITEYAVERLLRESLLYLLGEGTSDIQKLVIARRMLDGSEASLLGLP